MTALNHTAAATLLSIADHHGSGSVTVLVQPEMEEGRSPLVRIPPQARSL